MAHPIVVPNLSQGIKWQDLRKGLKKCIQAVAPKSRVWSSWPLKLDIGETVANLRSNTDNNKIHAWIISINRATPNETKAGGYNLLWDLDIRIWGFVGYSAIHDDSVQNIIEDECRLISQVIYLNSKHLGLDDTSSLKPYEPLVVWEDIDVSSFGEGNDIHVAQGNLRITLSETFNT